MTAPMLLDGAMHGRAVPAYVESILAPTLRRCDIVVMDSLPAHKPAAVRQAIDTPAPSDASCRPAARFNPIDTASARLKAFLKRHASGTVDDLRDTIARGGAVPGTALCEKRGRRPWSG